MLSIFIYSLGCFYTYKIMCPVLVQLLKSGLLINLGQELGPWLFRNLDGILADRSHNGNRHTNYVWIHLKM